MNRRAILLAATSEDKGVPSACSDLSAMCSFLRSNPGGAWDVKEIFQGENLTRDQILSVVKEAKGADYSLVFFAGPGEMVKMGLPWREMRLLMGSDQTITERELNSGSPRCTFILDCCRRTPKQGQETFLITDSVLLARGEGSVEFRSFYQSNLEAAESGLVKVYTTAVDDGVPNTHSFTQHLLNESNEWVAKNKGVLHLGEAVELARASMKRETPSQLPEYLGGRRLRHFPFTVQI